MRRNDPEEPVKNLGVKGRSQSLLTVVVQALRPAVSGRPEGLHYLGRFFTRSKAGHY